MPTYKDKKTNKYYVKINYKDWQGKSHQKMKRGFDRAADAKKYERDFLNSLSTSCSITFKNLCEHYLNDNKVSLKPTTYSTNRNIITKHIIPFFGDMPVNEITTLMIRKWQTDLLNEGNLSQTYLYSVNSKLSAVFNYAVRFYNLPYNPAKKAGTIGSSRAPTHDWWTLDEFKKFIAVFTNKEDESFRIAFITLFYTGLREGELLALTLSDIDFENGTLKIDKNYVQVDGKKIIQTPKTSKSNRVITMPNFLCELLKQYIKRLYDPQQRIFFNLNKFSLRRKMIAMAKKAGVKRIRIHDFRHSHASLLAELGIPPKVAQERLGHEDIKTTLQIYAHVYPEKNREVADKLDALKP